MECPNPVGAGSETSNVEHDHRLVFPLAQAHLCVPYLCTALGCSPILVKNVERRVHGFVPLSRACTLTRNRDSALIIRQCDFLLERDVIVYCVPRYPSLLPYMALSGIGEPMLGLRLVGPRLCKQARLVMRSAKVQTIFTPLLSTPQSPLHYYRPWCQFTRLQNRVRPSACREMTDAACTECPRSTLVSAVDREGQPFRLRVFCRG